MTIETRKYNLSALLIIVALCEIVFWAATIPVYLYLLENSNSFVVEQADYFWGFLIIPIIILTFVLNISWKNKSIKKFADARLQSNIFPSTSTTKVIAKYILIRFGLGLLIIALANPQYGIKRKTGKAEGIEIIIALDVSNSMLTRDMSSANRLQVAKRAINKTILENLGGDQVGLVIFAGSAFKHTALTTDHNALMYSLDMVEPYMISNQGTNISNAIETCLTSFNMESRTKKAIIIVSDGENHEPEAINAASKAYKENGVKIYTIGMGSLTGSRIPVYDRNNKLTGYKKDSEGNTVMSKLNEETLKNIADAGGGKYNKAESTELGLDDIINDINLIDKTKTGTTGYMDYSDQFMWFLAAGIMLLIPAMLIQTDTIQRKKKIKLFEV